MKKYMKCKLKKYDKINPVITPRNHIIDKIINNSNNGNYEELYKFEEQIKNPYDKTKDYLKPPLNNEKVYETFCGT